jgi:hypothetical protein
MNLLEKYFPDFKLKLTASFKSIHFFRSLYRYDICIFMSEY